MQAITLTIALFFSVLVLMVRPALAFAAYIILLLVYPTYLGVQLGSLEISAGRIVVTVLLIRCLCQKNIRKKFRWHTLDKCVLVYSIIFVIIPAIAWKLPLQQVLENRSGQYMDTFFPYFIARYCFTSKADFVIAFKWIMIVLVCLAVLGVAESTTGWQPYRYLKRFRAWNPVTEQEFGINMRSGFFRALGPFSHSITFGVTFVMFMPFIWMLRHESKSWRMIVLLSCCIMVLGVVSSMSSTPWMMMIFMLICFILERNRKLIKPLVVLLALGCIFISFASNRTFYHVLLDYMNPIGSGGYHRAKLIDLAIEDFGQWWAVGYGGQDPGWGKRGLGMSWTDITNMYISAAVSFGLLGLVFFTGILLVTLRKAYQSYNSIDDPKIKSWFWAMGSFVVVLLIIFNVSNLHGQAYSIYFCCLGLIGSGTCHLAVVKNKVSSRLLKLSYS